MDPAGFSVDRVKNPSIISAERKGIVHARLAAGVVLVVFWSAGLSAGVNFNLVAGSRSLDGGFDGALEDHLAVGANLDFGQQDWPVRVASRTPGYHEASMPAPITRSRRLMRSRGFWSDIECSLSIKGEPRCCVKNWCQSPHS